LLFEIVLAVVEFLLAVVECYGTVVECDLADIEGLFALDVLVPVVACEELLVSVRRFFNLARNIRCRRSGRSGGRKNACLFVGWRNWAMAGVRGSW
jgi:hypothetical protein